MRALSPFRLLSPGGPLGRLSIFIFHRVLEEPDPHLPDVPDAKQFERIAGFLGRYFNVLPLSEAVDRMNAGALPAAPACITFDDGYRDNLTVAAPILRKHELPATIFVATGFLDGGCMWNDVVIGSLRAVSEGVLDLGDLQLGSFVISGPESRVTVYRHLLKRLKHLDFARRLELSNELGDRLGFKARNDLMLSRAELRQLFQQGWEVGGHTVSHPILSCLDEAAAFREIAEGREHLTAVLGHAPPTFAYPNGVPGSDFGARDVALVRKAGFQIALTTSAGCNRKGDDPLQLKRFTPWDRSMLLFGARCAANVLRT